VQIRAQDVVAGDVVNKSGPLRDGWVEIAYTEPLPDGRINLCDESYRKSFVSEPLDLVWLQIAGTLKGNSHMPVDIPMFYERVPVQPELPPGRPVEVEARAASTQR
jgi:hypothetical protein